MKPDKQLVAIHGVPRSGTSWLAQIFRSAPEVMLRFQPLFSYAFKGRLTPSSTREEALRFFQELQATDDAFVLQRDPNIHVDYPDFVEQEAATHLVYKEVRYNHILANLMREVPELHVVGIVRHPCAVLDSWIHAPREFKPEWDVAGQWRSGALKNQGRPEEFFGFDKWMEVAELFLDLEARYPDRFTLVRYQDLNGDTVSVCTRLFERCGLVLGERTRSFIAESMSKQGGDANSVYRAQREDISWQGRLPRSIVDAVHVSIGDGPLARFMV